MMPTCDPITDLIEQLSARFEQKLNEREIATKHCLDVIEEKIVAIKENISRLSDKTVLLENELKFSLKKMESVSIITANPQVTNSYITEICNNLSLPGLHYVSEGSQPKLHRLFWILLHLGAILVSFVYIQNAYYQWQSSPVIQSFKSMSTKVNEIPFPAVTMCFPIPIKEDYDRWEIIKRCVSLESNTSWMCSEGELDTFVISIEMQPLKPSEFINVALSDWSLYEKSLLYLYNQSTRFFTGEEYHRYIDQLMMDCEKWKTNRIVHLLNGDLCGGSLSPKVLVKNTINRNVGKILMCVTYNGVKHGPQYKGVARVSEHNFDIELGVPVSPSVCDWTPERMLESDCQKGSSPVYNRKDVRIIFHPNTVNDGTDFFVMVHNPAEYPALEVMKSFRLPRRKSVIVEVMPELVSAEDDLTAVEVSKRGCLFSYEKSLSLFDFYTYHNCLLECQINCGLTNCGCIPSSVTILKNDFPVCGGSESCSLLNCKCDCPYDCTSLTYDTSMDINKDLAFNSVIAKLEYKNNEFPSRFRYSVTSPAEFVAYCLGILGVFNGFSVMLVWEILYWLTLRLWVTVRRTVKADYPRKIIL